MNSPYEALGSESGVRALVDRFYDVMDGDPSVATIRAMHGDSLEGIRTGLTLYLTEWLGGPKVFSQRSGGMCLTDAHRGFALNEQARDEWLYCMEQALADTALGTAERDQLKAAFYRIADFMRNM
ncbi:group II truncated hemoglobin [Ferrimonas pelagia]|uniref:Group II truncated hemoglobin n=1 Tax=Ferrimonas pelagia TaxID=1177826 RepID=A0ABP9ELJ5_9GAMM